MPNKFFIPITTLRSKAGYLSPWVLVFGLGLLNIALAATTPNTEPSLAEQLGWVTDPCFRCGGYYLSGEQLPRLQTIPNSLRQQTAVLNDRRYLIYAQHSQLILHQQFKMSGQVLLWQPDQQFFADDVNITFNHKQQQIQRIQLKNKILVINPDWWIHAEAADLRPSLQQATLDQVSYRFKDHRFNSKLAEHHEPSLVMHGKAKKLLQADQQHYQLQTASYSTCSPADGDWRLEAEKIHLDQNLGRGEAWHSKLYLHNIPIVYLPYINFPIDKRRQSGILLPSIINSSVNGLTIGIPYYFNLAPNYDWILTPTFMSKRGILWEGQHRYLQPQYQGKLHWSALPNDRQWNDFVKTAQSNFNTSPFLGNLLSNSKNRYALSWQHQQQFSPKTKLDIDYNWIKDDYLLRDIEKNLVNSNQYLLPQNLSWQWQDMHTYATVQLQSYQTLHPVNQALYYTPYRKLPHVLLQTQWPVLASPFHFEWQMQFAHLIRGRSGEDSTLSYVPVPQADRLHVTPSLHATFDQPFGYFHPSIHYLLTHYEFDRNNIGIQTTRVLPALMLDSGLFLDREYHSDTLQQDYLITLEPKVQIKLVPYKNQDHIPVFDNDSNLASYTSIYQLNRFNSLDRIGDSEQLLLGLNSRWTPIGTGQEQLQIGLVQQFNFQQPRINICQTPGCTTLASPANAGFKRGSGLIEIGFNPNDHWRTLLNFHLDSYQQKLLQSEFIFGYLSDHNHIFNLGWHYLRNSDSSSVITTGNSHLRLVQASWAWPFATNWQALGSVQHNFNRHFTQDLLLGLEYNSCCYALRAGFTRTQKDFANINEAKFHRMVYFQILLKGLGAMGNNQVSAILNDRIPGYEDRFVVK